MSRTKQTERITALRRAQEVGRMKHVQEWIEKFRALASTMPPEMAVFVMAGEPWAMALSPEREVYVLPNGSMDPYAAIGRVDGGRWDGGDW